MALRFIHQGKVFLVEGTINTKTIKRFKNHLEFLLLYTTSLTLNMDGVKAIDDNGFKVLKKLYAASRSSNKSFTIIGKGSEGIHEGIHSRLSA